MISLKNPEQIGKMRDAGALLYEVLCRLREAVQPGMSTAALDVYAEQLIRKNHAIPSFLHYEGYPASICASIDDAVVHGIPSEKQILQEGQILSIDCGLVLDGWQADSAFTMGIGEISPEAQRLIASFGKTTQAKAIEKNGNVSDGGGFSGGGDTIDYNELGNAVAGAVINALLVADIKVEIDKRSFGRLVSELI